MVARKPRKPAPELRTSRLILEGPDGRVQAVLEPGEAGPTFKLLDPQTGAERVLVAVEADETRVRLNHSDGKRRAVLRANETRSRIELFTQCCESRLDPLAALTAQEDTSWFALHAMAELPHGGVWRDPRIVMGARTHDRCADPQLTVWSAGGEDVLFELRHSRAGFINRLAKKLAEVTEAALLAEGVSLAPGELVDAYCLASDDAQGRVRSIGEARCQGEKEASCKKAEAS